MPRNLDMTALRSFVAVAESGGVTRASGFLNLTQSAVSMQLKRLEVSVGLDLLDRSGRTIALTSSGEQLLSYARRMLELNDEVFARLTHQDYEGEIKLGVPHDIVYPAIPKVLQRFACDYPRVRVQLISSNTKRLKEKFDHGECDLILTTEDSCDAGGETLIERALVWIGAPGGNAWKKRPLRLAFERACIFRAGAQRALDDAGIAWEMAVESNSTRSIEATVSADMALHVAVDGTIPHYMEVVQHGGALPELQRTQVNLYAADVGRNAALGDLVSVVRQSYQAMPGGSLTAAPGVLIRA
ncbi:MAG: LysR family transcriptional regulator [Rhodobacteraceae bacterium]|nr:LysR family transcriptional regulator [Paracoccaceae bacterium]